MNSNKEPRKRMPEFPPRRGLIKIKIFRSIFRTVKSIPEGFARSRREDETLTSTSTTPAPGTSGYNSEAQSES
ncbi:hypothetical protein E5676_scaffold74032G00010 [Cucumis melo var. makuwa]|uniref:Uncharacterized protein n=2 Tax=Cucumis melo TaxID=3656 RepID=A0A5D3CDP6_CUCMM|nr:hypothetical protein E5676_scaffold74032G00010 [Cucumis melo var. makuwa]